MSGKKISKKYLQARVEERTYDKFQAISIQRHGPKHGHVGRAAQEALELYIHKYGGILNV